MQLALFAPEPTPPVFKARLGGGPPSVQRRFALAMTEPVKLELIATVVARPDEWLKWEDFKVPREKHQIGFCMGHVLHALVHEGRLQERYQDYMHEWKAA